MKPSGNLMGIVLMTLAMLLIPTVDGLAKHLSGQHSPLYIGWARYAVASMVVLPFAVFSHGKRIFPQNNLGPHILRTVFLMSAMTLFFLAIARTPLATAISAYFVAPIIAAVLAVIFLKERLTGIKTAAVVMGFVGAIIILRPGMDMDIGVLLAMGAGAFFAFYVITTRQASRQSDPVRTLVFQCVVGTLILTPQAIWTWSLPAVQDLHLFLAMGCLSALSHILSITAFRYAEASTLAPLVYLELVSASIIGYFFFDDLPDFGIWIGAAVIVASGLLLLKSPKNKPADQPEKS